MPCAGCRAVVRSPGSWTEAPLDRADLAATTPDARCTPSFFPRADAETTDVAALKMPSKRAVLPGEANRQGGPSPAHRWSRRLASIEHAVKSFSRSMAVVTADKGPP